MVRTEVSALFNLKPSSPSVVRAHIGSGVTIQMIEGGWLEEVKNQCPKVDARELIEWNGPYTHRLFYAVAEPQKDWIEEGVTSSEEKQLILKAIVLSRLVKPTSIGYDSVWVKSFYRTDGTVAHYHDQVINNLNVAFVIPQLEDWNTITLEDAKSMSELWDSFNFLFDNEVKYRRVVRAIKTYEIACSIYFSEMAHTVMHAALESLICTGHLNNRAQVTQRLTQLVAFVDEDAAADIYTLCAGFKHSAEAMLQHSPSASGMYAPSDQRRVDAVKLLRRAIRDLLIRALRDRSFADLLADRTLLKRAYPVYDRKGNLVQ